MNRLFSKNLLGLAGISFLFCLSQSARALVRSDVAIILTDAPPHDPEPYTGYTADSVIKAANDADPIAIYSIVPGVNNNSYTAQAYQLFSKISAQTGGKFFATPTSSDIENALINQYSGQN